jgi:phage shock protein A
VLERFYKEGTVIMAESNFFGRVANLWSGFISLWVGDIEKRHPEIAYENAISSMVSKYTQLKSATAAIIRRRDDVQARLTQATRDLEGIKRDLETAIATEQDDLSMVLIEKKNLLEQEVAQLQLDMTQAKADADDAKSSLVAVKAEIDKLKTEKDQMLAKVQSAQARMRVQEQLDGLSVDSEVRALDTVRNHIKNSISEANLSKELRDSDLDQRLAKLRQQSGAVTARAELEALKAARVQGAQAVQGSQKKL